MPTNKRTARDEETPTRTKTVCGKRKKGETARGSQLAAFVFKCDSDLDDEDVELLAEEDDSALVIDSIPTKAKALHPRFVEAIRNFNGNGTVDNMHIRRLINLRNWLAPHNLPNLSINVGEYTAPFTICGEILPVRPILAADQEVQEWEFVNPMPDDRYDVKAWTLDGVTNYRGNFSYMHVWVGPLVSILNTGKPTADKAWLINCARTIGQASSPNNTRYGYILTIKTPFTKIMLDLVLRNAEFKASFKEGRRPIVAFSNVTFSYNKRINQPQLQTMFPQNNKPGARSTIMWLGNFKDLPTGFASQMANQDIAEDAHTTSTEE